MGRPETKKNFYADPDEALYEEFEAWRGRHRDPPKGECVIAAVELLMSLPDELGAIVVGARRDTALFKRVAELTAQAVVRVYLPEMSQEEVRRMATHVAKVATVLGIESPGMQPGKKAKSG